MAVGGSQYKVNGKSHYERNKEAYLERNRRKRAEVREILREVKSSGCVDCGNKDHRVLELDHVRGVKSVALGTAVTKGWGKTRLLEEIAKCDVRCANCHRIRTYEIQHATFA